MNIENYKTINTEVKSFNARLVAVSKTKTADDIMEVYNQGQRIFGENKAQEMETKYNVLPKDIEWHMIGHLQTNKVKLIAPFVTLIQSVDSLKLLAEIDKQAQKHNRVIDCLLQIFIASEETKFGLSEGELTALLESQDFAALKNVRICGLMGMATNTDNDEQIDHEFKNLNRLFSYCRNKYFADKPYFQELSMGMSSDYPIALNNGATLIRVGSLIFGERH